VVEDDARGGLPVGDVADVGGLGAADGDVGEVVVEGGELFEGALALAAGVGADEEPVGGEAGVAAAAGLVGGRLAVGGVGAGLGAVGDDTEGGHGRVSSCGVGTGWWQIRQTVTGSVDWPTTRSWSGSSGSGWRMSRHLVR